ncbi:unnamed protein product, partial [Brachionus calyciflorus]
MDIDCTPFDSLKDLMIFMFIKSYYCNSDVLYAIDLFNLYKMSDIPRNHILNFLVKINLSEKFQFLKFFEEMKDLIMFFKTLKTRVVSNISRCCKCMHNQFTISYFDVNLYTFIKGPLKCEMEKKKCKKCLTSHYLSFYTCSDKLSYFYDDFLTHEFISFTNETVFERTLLDKLTSDIIFKHCSFQAFVNSYNYYFNFILNIIEDKIFLQEKRLIEAWLYYRFKKSQQEFICIKSNISNIDINDYGEFRLAFCVKDIDEHLKLINRYLSKNFTSKWSGNAHHSQCLHKMCSLSVSVDGNHKINRLKCLNSSIYYKSKEFGNILTGCPNTPDRNSYYCAVHKNVDKPLVFNYLETKLKCFPNQIKLKQKGKLGNVSKLCIYDCFVTQDDKIY